MVELRNLLYLNDDLVLQFSSVEAVVHLQFNLYNHSQAFMEVQYCHSTSRQLFNMSAKISFLQHKSAVAYDFTTKNQFNFVAIN